MVGLVDLNDDITLAVLLLCDVFTILSIGQTCKYLHKMSLLRHLWYMLAISLDYDHAPNLAPHESVQSLPTDRLREMVIRSTRLYLNWSRPEGPKPTRSISFKIPVRSKVSYWLHKLLPGGKFFIVLDEVDCRFDFYDTESQKQIFSYTEVPSLGKRILYMDCLLLDTRNTFVLAYVPETLVYSSVTIVRFNIHSGISDIVRKFALSGDNKCSSIHEFIVGREVVVIREYRRILVFNWRTGETREINFEHESPVHSLFILQNHLCVVGGECGQDLYFSAIPLSDIFRNKSGYDSGKSTASTPCTSLRSQDVFQESTRVTLLITNNRDTRILIDSVSICMSSWKTPSLCEHDAPANPTRICFLVSILYTYMVSELLFSPKSPNPLDTPSILSRAGTPPPNNYLVTCQGQLLGGNAMPYLTSATRAGCLFAIFSRPLVLDTDTSTYYATAINMLKHMEKTLSDGSTNPNELFIERLEQISPIDSLLDDAFPFDLGRVEIEPYSGTIWYCSGSKLFIHHTD